jgi:membrane protein
VPNAPVRRRDALVGGCWPASPSNWAKRGFTVYLLKVPTYKAIYGGFAAVPVFLLWVYYSWLVTLAAALVAANLHRPARVSGRRTARA